MSLVVPDHIAWRRGGNLPAEVTTFVGRRRELADLRRLLERARLVMLTGAGGVGKTRLALRLAAEVRRSFADGAWLVELSSVRNAQLVPHAVAAALGLSDRSADKMVDVLADHLAGRHALLILDTCEHLVDACALLAEVLLRAAPGLRIVATSREPLGVGGEYTFQLAPLSVPGPSSAESAQTAESMELFTDRAGAVLHGFTLTADNRRHVARLCHRLDGLPLAIELAVVQLRALPLAALVERLDDRFRTLGTARTSQDRHQTLYAAVDWSHELCTGRERLLWARLSVFPGGFDLAAAEAVCADRTLPAEQIFAVLADLVKKSILQYDQDTGRYRMLDTLREYGLQRLDLLNGSAELRSRHCATYQARIEDAVRRWHRDGQAGLLADLDRESANLRAAFDHALTTPGRRPAGLAMIASLDFYWMFSGQLGEGYQWLALALDRCPEPTGRRAVALAVTAFVAGFRGDLHRARTHVAEARRIAGTLDRPLLTAYVLHAAGLLEYLGGGPAGGGPEYATAIEIYEAEGYDQPLARTCLAQLATVEAARGEFDRAIELCDRCIHLAEGVGDLHGRSFGLWVRSVPLMMSGRLQEADSCLKESLRLLEIFGDLAGITIALDLAACVAALQGDAERAAALFGAADRLWRFLKSPPPGPHYLQLRDAVLARSRKALGDQRHARAFRSGAVLTVAEAIAFARGKHAPAAARAPARRSAVTKREWEIVALVAEGLSNREIAERLVIAKRTADSHLEHILDKLGFTSRAQIAAWFAAQQDR